VGITYPPDPKVIPIGLAVWITYPQNVDNFSAIFEVMGIKCG
jgi:hypothetical protein